MAQRADAHGMNLSFRRSGAGLPRRKAEREGGSTGSESASPRLAAFTHLLQSGTSWTVISGANACSAAPRSSRGVARVHVCRAVFAWPLPVHLSDSFLGDPKGDTGGYVWNLWVFRHEIVAHHAFPFLTHEILTLDPAAVPLALHNYTTFANVVAFLLLGAFDLVTVFNLITIGSGIMAAYAMFLFAARRTGDSGAAFLGGLLFGFSPFMSARAEAHFSLVQVAPIPIFGLVLFSMFQRPTLRLAAVAGVVMAWAFLSDPYLAVYCLMMLMVMVGYSLATIERRPADTRSVWWRMVLDLLLLSLGGPHRGHRDSRRGTARVARASSQHDAALHAGAAVHRPAGLPALGWWSGSQALLARAAPVPVSPSRRWSARSRAR